MKIIVFDFDGVLINSVAEHYLVSIKAFKELDNKVRETKASRKKFYFLRPFAKKADDFYALLTMLQEGNPLNETKIPKLRDKILAAREEEAKEFVKLYYENRKKLLQKGFKLWLKLQRPNKKVIEMMRWLSGKYPVYIATTRDKETTLKMLKSFDVRIPKNRVFSKEETPNKAEQMKLISKASSAPLKKIIFIEDNFENLVEASKTGIKPVLVEWGYSTIKQRKEARKLGIPVLTKRNFEKQLMKIIGD